MLTFSDLEAFGFCELCEKFAKQHPNAKPALPVQKSTSKRGGGVDGAALKLGLKSRKTTNKS